MTYTTALAAAEAHLAALPQGSEAAALTRCDIAEAKAFARRGALGHAQTAARRAASHR
jgi:hypothetical protein